MIFLGFFYFPLLLFSQNDTVLITKNFEFQDGIYLDLSSLQKNKPDISWNDVNGNLAANPQTYLTQVEYISYKETQDTLNMESIFAICLGGIPFVRLPKEATDKELTTFAGLRVRGRICYFNYEIKVKTQKPFSAYNPLNGRPFRTAMIEREEIFVEEKLLNFSSGEIVPFTKSNFLEWIKEDEKLWQTVQDLEGEELTNKLFKTLLIFDDRHPIYLKN